MSNDTVIEVYGDVNMTNKLYENDDYGGARFSKVVMPMTTGTSYYIKLRHHNTSSQLHADLKITKNVTPVTLTEMSPRNIEVAALEFAVFSATLPASAGGQYLIYTGFYNNAPHTDGRDSVIEVYSDQALTNRVAASTYVKDTFSQISVSLEGGQTYYITFSGYLGKAAKARIYLSQMTVGTVTDLNYNNGTEPMLGHGNTLKFKLNGGPGLYYYAAPSLSWDGVNYYDKTENMTFVSFTEIGVMEFTINNISLTSPNSSVLHTKIKFYNAYTSERTPLWESPDFVHGLGGSMPAPLNFTRQDGGKYIFSDNPETIREDFVVNGNGARHWIMRNPGLQPGNTDYTLAMYHNAELNYEVTLDAEFYAPNGAEIVVKNLGAEKVPNNVSWASVRGYTDYIWQNVDGKTSEGVDVVSIRNSCNLPQTYTIAAGERKWLKDIYEDIYNSSTDPDYPRIGNGSNIPMFVMLDFTISYGSIDLNIMAYKNSRGSGSFNWNGAAHYIFDNHGKGVSPYKNQVNADLEFYISNVTHPSGQETQLDVSISNSFTSGHVENNGIWFTRVNPFQNQERANVAAQSDLLPFYYYDPYNPTTGGGKPSFYGSNIPDSQKEDYWVFDLDRTHIRTPHIYKTTSGSYSILRETGNFPPNPLYTPATPPADFKPNDFLDSTILPSGVTKYDAARSFGNYGVVENYTIRIYNSGGTKRLWYHLYCNSNVFVSTFNGYILSPKMGGGNYLRKFDLGAINANGWTTLNFTVCMPTADDGEFNNRLVVK